MAGFKRFSCYRANAVLLSEAKNLGIRRKDPLHGFFASPRKKTGSHSSCYFFTRCAMIWSLIFSYTPWGRIPLLTS